jgi:hypothetical protein
MFKILFCCCYVFLLLLCEEILLGRILLRLRRMTHLSMILKLTMMKTSLMTVILTFTHLHLFQTVEVF